MNNAKNPKFTMAKIDGRKPKMKANVVVAKSRNKNLVAKTRAKILK